MTDNNEKTALYLLQAALKRQKKNSLEQQISTTFTVTTNHNLILSA